MTDQLWEVIKTRLIEVITKVKITDYKRLNEFLDDMYARYSSRKYHNLQHIYFMLKRYDEACIESDVSAEENIIINLSIIFHDVFYDCMADNSEKLSGDYAAEFLSQVTECPEQMIEIIRRDILETESNNLYKSDKTGAVLSDLDYIIFATDGRMREKARILTRKEYAIYSAEDFYLGRADYFERILLGNSRIMQTKYFHHLEELVRGHIREEINYCKAEILHKEFKQKGDKWSDDLDIRNEAKNLIKKAINGNAKTGNTTNPAVETRGEYEGGIQPKAKEDDSDGDPEEENGRGLQDYALDNNSTIA